MSQLNNTIYHIALGSNLGNKLNYLQEGIQYIFQKIGVITKISSVYSTPALGFDGEDFYNAAIEIKSRLNAEQVLDKLLSIETSLGRERANGDGYSSRTLDLDLIYAENQILNTEKLILPHPRLQDRKFVLEPLIEIAPYFVHPILKKTNQSLLKETSDESEIIITSEKLRNPVLDYPIQDISYLVIEGNIGAGKTSLSQMIASDFGGKLILERFRDNPFLPKFYEDPNRYAFPLEMSFLADRYQQFLDDIRQFDLFSDFVIADYDLNKSLIFAEVTLQEQEFELYKKLFNLMYKEVSRPKKYVFLYQETERLLENIKKRGRTYEQSIKAEYLEQIHRGYIDFIKSQTQQNNIKVIDVSEMDFVENRADYLSLLREICS